MSTLTISIIQPDLQWEDKDANLRRFEEMIGSIAGPTEVVILPEMFSTGFSMRPEALAEKSERHQEHHDALHVCEIARDHRDRQQHAGDNGSLAREGK